MAQHSQSMQNRTFMLPPVVVLLTIALSLFVPFDSVVLSMASETEEPVRCPVLRMQDSEHCRAVTVSYVGHNAD